MGLYLELFTKSPQLIILLKQTVNINRDVNGEDLTLDRVSDDMVPQYHLKNRAIHNVIEHSDP